MELDNPAWRTWWTDVVLVQMAHNDDGLFADSFSVPNYLGGDSFMPALPGYDPAFEAAWTGRMERFMAYLQTGAGEEAARLRVGVPRPASRPGLLVVAHARGDGTVHVAAAGAGNLASPQQPVAVVELVLAAPGRR